MRKIAVVEDNEDNRMLLRGILEDFFAIDEYAEGSTALTGIAKAIPELVLMDISLPGMDGVEILSRLRADPALGRIPVIALTAHAMVGDREKYLAAGFDDYVSKPIVDENLLLAAIRRALTPTPAPHSADTGNGAGPM